MSRTAERVGRGARVSSILVLGGSGMLGHKMFQTLEKRFPDTRCTLRDGAAFRSIEFLQDERVVSGVDAMDFATVDATIEQLQPDVVVNCVGVIKQRPFATDAIRSLTINALLPHLLAEKCRSIDSRLIHFSTDCVFRGDRGDYLEEDISDATDLYGRTKYLGEVGEPGSLTLRTSMVGREIHGFQSLLEWFLAQAETTVKGFTRVIYSGLTTNAMSAVVADLIEQAPSLVVRRGFDLVEGGSSAADLL